MSDKPTCPNCGEELTNALFRTNKLLHPAQVALINEVKGKSNAHYCNRCGNADWREIAPIVQDRLATLSGKVQGLIDNMPVVTLMAPLDWKYEVVQIVTGQSTTGTGVFSEFTSSFTDLFGRQSGAYNSKLREGEKMCMAQLRMAALKAGANAVIGTDIDYSELGAEKGMTMVCMAGTAVRLKDLSVLPEEQRNNLASLIEAHQQWQAMQHE